MYIPTWVDAWGALTTIVSRNEPVLPMPLLDGSVLYQTEPALD